MSILEKVVRVTKIIKILLFSLSYFFAFRVGVELEWIIGFGYSIVQINFLDIYLSKNESSHFMQCNWTKYEIGIINRGIWFKTLRIHDICFNQSISAGKFWSRCWYITVLINILDLLWAIILTWNYFLEWMNPLLFFLGLYCFDISFCLSVTACFKRA